LCWGEMLPGYVRSHPNLTPKKPNLIQRFLMLLSCFFNA